MKISSKHPQYQTVRLRQCLPSPVCRMSCVTCLVSCVMCQVSGAGVTSFVYYFFVFFLIIIIKKNNNNNNQYHKVVELVSRGSVIDGAFPSSFYAAASNLSSHLLVISKSAWEIKQSDHYGSAWFFSFFFFVLH